MGREWYLGGKASNSKRGRERDTTPSGCMCAVFQFFDFHQFQFPLHQQTSFKPNSFLPEEPTIPKGVEAPRNSLESDVSILSSTVKDENLNIPMGIQIKTSADTRSKVGTPNDSFSEISSSPGTKTPNLVARLMGLELLPESHSPSSSSTQGTPSLQAKSHLHRHFRPRQTLHSKSTSHRNSMDTDNITGTRSLPETPRISSARRSDVDHRLSLQINKENVSVSEELEFSRFSSSRRKELKREDENRSPSHYARQIVKQVKENVSRKVGLDITNTIKNRDQGREELVSQFIKSRKNSRILTKVGDESSPGKHSTPSCSPRLRFLDPKNKPTTAFSSSTKDHIPQPLKITSCSSFSQANNYQPQPIKASSKPKLQPLLEQQRQQQQHQQRPIRKCKKAAGEGFSPRLKKPPQTSDIIRNKQEEPFVRPSTANRVNIPDKKCKKIPLSNDLLNTTVPTLFPPKKDPAPPSTKVPQKQVSNAQVSKFSSQLSSCPVQRYKQETTHTLVAQENEDDRSNGAAAAAVSTTTGGGAEYEYVTRILRRTGLDKDTPVSFTRWFSPSHPLDPSLFYYLEHFTTVTIPPSKNIDPSSQLTHRCNRKLLFHLADEILVEILKPCINVKPWVTSNQRDNHNHMQGSELIDALFSKIRSFPCANCCVLEDIDAIIEKDLPQLKLQSAMAYEEEGEGIVSEMEKDILDTLIHETTVDIAFGVVAI